MAAFMAQVGIEALKEQQMLAALSEQYEQHSNQKW